MSLNSPFTKMLVPAVTIAVVAIAAHFIDLSWSGELRLVLPSLPSATFWIVVWIAWVAISERISSKLSIPRPRKWKYKDTTSLVLLFIGIVVLAPIAEELLFRGLLYWRFKQTRAGDPGAILATALVFAILHLQYGWRERLLILLDGILIGTARWQSDSLLLTICLHTIGNAYAYYQRLPTRREIGPGS